jgi:lipopolysaccharide/colanic/teichoic acid biosynthesis glycosyltransferase
MKIGPEYVHSREKRRRDIRFALAMLPACYAVQLTVFAGSILQGRPWQDTIYAEPRLGAYDQEFGMFKVKTRGRGGNYDSRMAKFLSLHGLDELANANNVLLGDMSIFGYRPINRGDRDETYEHADTGLVDQHKRLVVPTRPGIISSFGIVAHEGIPDGVDGHNLRLELDIKDVIDASPKYDWQLLTGLLARMDGFSEVKKQAA